MTSRTRDVTGFGGIAGKPFEGGNVSEVSRPKMPFPGAKSAFSGVSGAGVAMFSPCAAYAPTRGTAFQPGAANRFRDCGAQITEGVFIEKGTEKVHVWYRSSGMCVMFGGLSGCQVGLVSGKTRFGPRQDAAN
jgi:hypothetical protein